MSGHDLLVELSEKVRLLDVAISQLKTRGSSYAQAEHDYKVALSQQMLTERDGGLPATILSDVCRGKKHIAKLRFERDVAEVSYKAAQEAINSYKLQIRIMDSQISREYGAVK